MSYDYEVIENGSGTQDEYYCALQVAVNDGAAWKFQGSVGRNLMESINEGAILLGRKPAADYYGNRIPSRDEVKPGTKGSYDFVVEHFGVEHADMLAAL